jgi:aryl-alcohol dehydrogenase-like predicted oxidoreductase
MKQNRLGKSDLFVSEIGFGCMSLGGDETEDIRIIHKAIDEGINFFDTADLYQHGRNEELLGKALRGKRTDVIIATKVGNRHYEDGSGWFWDPSKEHIKKAVHYSLKRLQTDYIDLYQLHGGTLEDPIDETIETFEELKQEGVIRYYGISSIRPNVIREYVNRSNIVSVMMQYSILDRRPEEEALDLLHANQISVIARGPIAKGVLSDRKQPISEGYLDYDKEELARLVSKLKDLAHPGRSLTQLALRYPLQHPAVATIIPGASKLEQLLQNVSASQIQLTEQEYEQIRFLSKQNKYTVHR